MLLRGVGKSPAFVDPLAAYLVYDTFTDTNGVTLANHTPDKDTVGTGWLANVGGGFTIQGNALDCNGANDQFASIDCGAVAASVKVASLVVGNDNGLIARSSSGQSCIMVEWAAGRDAIELYTVNPGYTGIGSYAQAITAGDAKVNFELRYSGNSLTVLDNGTSRVTATNALNNTLTRVGVFGYSEGGTAGWDTLTAMAI